MIPRRLVSVREFARNVQISDTAVHKMFANGTLPEQCKVVPEGKSTYKIDFDMAMAAFVAAGGAPKSTDYQGGPRSNRPLDEASRETAELPQANTKRMKDAEHALKVALLKQKLDTNAGRLVERRAVDMEIFAAGRYIRDRVQEIPDTAIDDILAVAEDRHAARLVLKRHVDKLLHEIAKRLEKYDTN